MSLFSKIEESIERGFRKWTERMFGPADSDELLLVHRAILESIESRVQTVARGRRVFPYGHVTVTLVSADPDRRALYQTAFGEGGRRHGGLRNGRLCNKGRSRLSAHPPNVRGGATYLEQPAPRRPARVNRLRAGLPALRGRSPFSRAPGGAVRAPSQHHRGTMVGDDRLGRKNETVPLISLLLTATREPGCQQPPGCDCVRGTRPG